MAVLKLRLGGEWVTLSGGADVLAISKSYADQLKEQTDADIRALQVDIGNTNDYIDNSFRDGVISETESKKISGYLNNLNTSKVSLDERTSQIIDNKLLPQFRKDSLTSAKQNFDDKYTLLVSSVNSAIIDGKATPEENADVDSKFTDYNNAVSLLVSQLELSLDDISQSKVDSSQQFSTVYSDNLKSALNIDIANVKDNVSKFKSYIDTSFNDGIIYDAELTQINSWLTTLNNDKAKIEIRYSSIHDDKDLTETTAKTNLETSKSSYNTDYQSLIDSINTSIADQLTDATELANVDARFVDYTNSISLLAASSETAIDSITQVRGDRANANALIASTAAKKDLDVYTIDLQNKVNNLQTSVDQGFSDYNLSPSEISDLQSKLNELGTAKSNYDGQYNTLYNNQMLTSVPRNSMASSKIPYNEKYNTLVNEVNNAVNNNIYSSTEKNIIDTDLTSFSNSILDFKTQLYAAIDFISQRNADNAEFGAYNYTDTRLVGVDERITQNEANTTQNAQDIADAKNNIVYKVEILSSNGLIFKNGNLNTILSGRVQYGASDVTDQIDATRFIWTKSSDNTVEDAQWNSSFGNGVKTLVITETDVNRKATFKLEITN